VRDGLPGLIIAGWMLGLKSGGCDKENYDPGSGFASNGVPEFVRARKAIAVLRSIDDVARTFKEGTNGGYAHDWLIAAHGRVNSSRIGLKNVTLDRKTAGIFVWLNFPDQRKAEAEGRIFL